MVKLGIQFLSIIQKSIEENEHLIKNATRVLEDLKGGDLSSRLTKDSNNEALTYENSNHFGSYDCRGRLDSLASLRIVFTVVARTCRRHFRLAHSWQLIFWRCF